MCRKKKKKGKQTYVLAPPPQFGANTERKKKTNQHLMKTLGFQMGFNLKNYDDVTELQSRH